MLVEVTKNATAVSAAMTTATTAAMTVRDILPPLAIIRVVLKACQSTGSLALGELRRDRADLVDVLGVVVIGDLQLADGVGDALTQCPVEAGLVVGDVEHVLAAGAGRVGGRRGL